MEKYIAEARPAEPLLEEYQQDNNNGIDSIIGLAGLTVTLAGADVAAAYVSWKLYEGYNQIMAAYNLLF